MISKEEVRRLAEERATERGAFVVDVEVNVGNKIVVEIDSNEGVTIDDCVSVSRNIEANLNREEEDFDLQVTSPGLDKPYKIQKQYFKNIGRQVQVVTLAGEKLTGTLKEADEAGIVLETNTREKQGKKKVNVVKEYNLPYEKIKEAKTVISFK